MAGGPGARWVGGTSLGGSGDGTRQEAGSQHLKTGNRTERKIFLSKKNCTLLIHSKLALGPIIVDCQFVKVRWM